MTDPTHESVWTTPAERYLRSCGRDGVRLATEAIDAMMASLSDPSVLPTTTPSANDAESPVATFPQADGSSMSLHGWLEQDAGWIVEIHRSGGAGPEHRMWIQTGLAVRPDALLPPPRPVHRTTAPTGAPASEEDAAELALAGVREVAMRVADVAAATLALRCLRAHLSACSGPGHDEAAAMRSIREEATLAACVLAPERQSVEVVHPTPWGPPRVLVGRGHVPAPIVGAGPPRADLHDPGASDRLPRMATTLDVSAADDGGYVDVEPVDTDLAAPDPMERLRILAAHAARRGADELA